MYPSIRNVCNASGATVGFYYLNSYLEGKVPETSATVFVNLWKLQAVEQTALKALIKRRGGVVIWQYAPGFMNDKPTDGRRAGFEGILSLTGIQTRFDKGKLGSTGVGPLEGIGFGGSARFNPRIIVNDSDARLILPRAGVLV